MLFPLLFLAGGVAFMQSRKPAPLAPPAPPVVEVPGSVNGWAGRGGLAVGALSVRLRPLHEDETRQIFDAASLARRLDLEAGQPWSLELSWRVESESAPAPLELEGLSVCDDEGEAAGPLPRVETIAETGVADPLSVLLAPPARLRPGETRRLVLWGREPRDGAELRGSFGSIGLRSERFELSERPLATARLERELDRLVRPRVREDEPGNR